MPTNNAVRTKVVVRKLPASYSSEEFLKYVSPLEDHNYYYFVSGCNSGEQFSRAYFNFLSMQDTNLFKERYDAYVFLDQKGEEFTAQVEYAPYQKIPLSSSKLDSMIPTIESDTEYLKFVAGLEKADETGKASDGLIDSLDALKAKLMAEHGTTPLLDFMKSKEVRKQVREDKPLRRAERPSKSKLSRGSRKERMKEKMTERKGKSGGEREGTASKGLEADKGQEKKAGKEAGKEVHVETIINNTKSFEKDLKKARDVKSYNDEAKHEKGRGKHSYEKQRRTLKGSKEAPEKSSDRNSSFIDKPIKILTKPSNESIKAATLKTLGKLEAKEGKDEMKKNKKDKVLIKEGGSEARDAEVKKMSKENSSDDSRNSRKPRIRNKDRPERPIYKPGPRKKE